MSATTTPQAEHRRLYRLRAVLEARQGRRPRPGPLGDVNAAMLAEVRGRLQLLEREEYRRRAGPVTPGCQSDIRVSP